MDEIPQQVESPSVPVRRPALVAFACLAVGMVLDRYVPVELVWWLATLGLLLGICLLLGRWAGGRVLTGLLVLTLIAAGGARHHVAWQVRAPDNIALFASGNSQLMQVRGYALEAVTRDEAEHSAVIPAWMQLDRSLLPLRCTALLDRGEWIPVSGDVRLEVNGHLLDVAAGDELIVLGEFLRPLPPRNPGGFDFAAYLRARGQEGTLRCDHPLAVQKVSSGAGLWWWGIRQRDRLRASCLELMRQHLSPDVQPVAASLLLGDRTQMTDDVRAEFAESGTMHLLAISGLHVGILIGLVYVGCRLFNAGIGATTFILLTVALGYATLTIARPPVLRAVLLTILMLIAQLRMRPAQGLNLLGAAALILVLWHPGDLFDVGAQLSFIAVWAIVASSRWLQQWQHQYEWDDDLPIERSKWWEAVRGWGSYLAQAYLVTGAIWFATLPLTMAWFHIVAPVGVLINVLLIPLTAVILASGFLFLAVGLLMPVAAGWVAIPFDWSLQLLHHSVDWCSDAGWGHWYVSQVPGWWLVGFYLLLTVAWRLWGHASLAFPARRLLMLWLLFGLGWGLLPRNCSDLRCTFIAVGHGNAVLLELPDGRNLLYDGGTFGHGGSATRTIERVLWDRGVQRLDAVLVSHADMDHFNGVSGLVDHIPVGSLFVARSFLDFRQEGVVNLCDVAASRGIPIRLVQAGDELAATGLVDPAYRLRIQHPAGNWHSEEDNANSVVLLVEFGGKRILLTGDVEGPGLTELLQQPTEPIDVLMAPHHGSRNSNPSELYEWASPQFVVASTSDAAVASRLQERAGEDVTIWTTAQCGAVTVTIPASGELRTERFLKSLLP